MIDGLIGGRFWSSEQPEPHIDRAIDHRSPTVVTAPSAVIMPVSGIAPDLGTERVMGVADGVRSDTGGVAGSADVRGRPGRRALMLGAVGGLAGLVLGGCSRSGHDGRPTATTPRPPTPDELAAGRAVLSARLLIGQESSLIPVPAAVKGSTAALGRALVADHRAHLVALGAPEADPPSTSPVAGASSAGAPSSSSIAATPTAVAPATVRDALTHERAAAAEALADAMGTTARTAGLLARIAAARTVHADRLALIAGLPPPAAPVITASAALSSSSSSSSRSVPSPSPSGSVAGSSSGTNVSGSVSAASAQLDAATIGTLSRTLAGEHAAVFAYGLITARASGTHQMLARRLWEAHRARRDELERRLAAAGVSPPAALPAYDVGRVPTTPAQLSALAARVENGLAAVAVSAVSRTAGPLRAEAALDLVAAARRAAEWLGGWPALPG
jgi:hypothetical protein